jgi:phage terminase large subunit
MEIIKGDVKHLFIPLQFRPQQLDIIKNLGRFNLLVAHRRFGKTWFCGTHLVMSALTSQKKNPKFWYICPQEKQARNNMWNHLKQMAQYLPNVNTNEARLEITFDLEDGKGPRTVGLKGVDKGGDNLRGAYLDGVVLDEMKDMPMSAWTGIIAPMLADRKGWAILTGTAGLGPWHEMFVTEESKQEDDPSMYKIFNIKASESGVLPEEELKIQRSIMTGKKYAQEYENDWNAVDEGSYYGDIISGLEEIGQISTEIAKFDAQKPVYTSWDLGRTDATAVWFIQEHPTKQDHWNVVDYMEQNIGDYIEDGGSTKGKSFDIIMFQKVLKKGYFFGAHILPHDSVHKHISAEYSTYEKIKEMSGSAKILVAPKTSVEGRIQAVQHELHKYHFNKLSCLKGIHSLQGYRAKHTSDGTEMSVHHNWASHGADSFGYFVTSHRLIKDVLRRLNPSKHRNMNKNKKPKSYNPLGSNNLF